MNTSRLLARGDHVTVVDDLSTGTSSNLDHVREHEQLTVRTASISDPALVRDLVAGADEVYHLAAAVGVALIARQPIETIERNIYPTQLIVDELLRRHEGGEKVKLFLASTSEVYGKNPKAAWNEEDDLVLGSTSRARWSYGASKAIDEFLTLACWRQFRLPLVVARFFNVVGPRQSGAYGMVLPRFVSAAVADRPVVVHDDGQQSRCFAHVNDVVDAILALMESSTAAGRVYNIGSDQPITILDLARLVIATAESESEVEFQSYTQAYDEDFEDVRQRVPDLSRLRSTIDFQPQYDLEKIVKELIELERSRVSGESNEG